MTWNYRVCKKTYQGHNYEEVSYEVREVYYNKAGEITGVIDKATYLYGESPEELKEVLKRMEHALTKDIVDLDTLVFAKHD
jgi:hypothetical protein